MTQVGFKTSPYGIIYPWGLNPSGYRANGVTLNGTSTYATKATAFSGVSNGKSGLISVWFKNTGAAGTGRYIFDVLHAGPAGYFRLYITSSTNGFILLGGNSSNTQILNVQSNSTYTGMSSYSHGLFSWNLATTRGQVYIDDADDIKAAPTLTNDTIVYNGANIDFGAANDESAPWTGSMADFQTWFNVDVDISTTANRRLFIDAAGNPVNPNVARAALGAPDVLCQGHAAEWFTNKGSGGGFTPNDGSLVDAADNP